jgi:multiple sugar transport system ATP-binding protein
MSSVRLSNINKIYDNGAHAIVDLSLEINDGEFLVLVGPSGCGKSTALRMIAGLESVTSGELSIGDRVVNDIEPKDRDIAMVFQNYALYPHMTVAENIEFALKMAKVSKSERRQRAERAAEILELTEYLDRKPGQLSGGQRQRVAMGRAIVREPSVFLMDEPLSNLDAKLRVQMRSEIAAIQKSLNVTTVYVTHDQVEAMTMGDRVAVMKFGVLQQVDTPERLYNKPANAFVAGFIGSPSMNLFEVGLQHSEPGYTLCIGDQLLNLPVESVSDLPDLEKYVGHSVILGIRPEDIEDSIFANDQRVGARLTARIELVESLGSEIIAHFDVGQSRLANVDPDTETELTSGVPTVGRFDPRSTVRIGDEIEVVVNIDKLHFFDPETQLAL